MDTLQGYLLDIQRLLIQLHRSANERPAPFVDHLGILRDSKTGRPINGTDEDEEDEVALCEFFFCFFFLLFSRSRILTIFFNLSPYVLAGYSFFDSGEVALLGRKKTSPFSGIGKEDFHCLRLPSNLFY